MTRLLPIAILLAATAASAQTACEVTAVHDGDTLTATCAGVKTHIRLAEIDAPELKQPYGNYSANHLRSLCVNRMAIVTETGKDRYGRTIAHVQCRGVDASREQVVAGLAWVYDRYVVDRSLYAEQAHARESERGLWRNADPVPPWTWRKGER